MRLLVHNMLQCHKEKCQAKSFPLQIQNTQIDYQQTDFNPAFIQGLIAKIDYPALRSAASCVENKLPSNIDENLDEDTMKEIHRVLMEVKIVNGELKCNNCGRIYPVKDGIPNMLLREDEI